MSIIRKRVEPRVATVEEDINELVNQDQVKRYAPPQHLDRIDASAQIMCDGIDKLFAGASEENQKIVEQAETALNEMKRFKAMVDDGMREAADGLKKHLCHVMALLQDGTGKMKQNPFNGNLPALLEKQQQQDEEQPAN